MLRRMMTWALCVGFVAFAGWAANVTAAGESAAAPGKKAFLKFKCNSCHSLEAASIGKVKDETEEAEAEDKDDKRKPPDLSGVGKKRTAAWIEAYVLKKEMIEGKRHKKKFRGKDDELKAIAAWLETFKSESKTAK